MNYPLSFTGLFLLLLSACSTLSVNVDYNPAYDFTTLKSYVWLDDGQPVSDDSRVNNDLIVGRVRAAVEKNLEERGYVKGERGTADFVVSWLGAIDTRLQVATIDHFYSPYGYGSLYRDPFWNGSGGMRTSTTSEYEVGTLIIDILDPVQHKLIWRGTGKDRIGRNKNPEAVTRGLNEAVSAIMKDFPSTKRY